MRTCGKTGWGLLGGKPALIWGIRGVDASLINTQSQYEGQYVSQSKVIMNLVWVYKISMNYRENRA